MHSRVTLMRHQRSRTGTLKKVEIRSTVATQRLVVPRGPRQHSLTSARSPRNERSRGPMGALGLLATQTHGSRLVRGKEGPSYESPAPWGYSAT